MAKPAAKDGRLLRQQLWQTYRLLRAHRQVGISNDELEKEIIEVRNRILDLYLPLVESCARRVMSRLPAAVDIEDLQVEGVLGLMEAVERFDTTRNIKFETYAPPRIRGKMIDHLRAIDWVPRLSRDRIKNLEAAANLLTASLGRPPSTSELARQLGCSEIEVVGSAQAAHSVRITSLERHVGGRGQETPMHDLLADPRTDNPLLAVKRKLLKDMITQNLSRAERLIVLLYYYEEMSMREIGLVLDLSESRVSQMHKSILCRLKARMEGQKETFAVGT